MTYALIILASAILYRVRGSDELLGEDYTQEKRILWAFPVAFMIMPEIYGLGLALWLWLAVTLTEKSDAEYGPQPEARQGTCYFALTLYGILCFNPLFGAVHYVTYKFKDSLPILPLLKGHAEWAEFLNGGLSAAFALLIWGITERVI